MSIQNWINFTGSNGRTYRTNETATVVAYWDAYLCMWIRSVNLETYAAARLAAGL